MICVRRVDAPAHDDQGRNHREAQAAVGPGAPGERREEGKQQRAHRRADRHRRPQQQADDRRKRPPEHRHPHRQDQRERRDGGQQQRAQQRRRLGPAPDGHQNRQPERDHLREPKRDQPGTRTRQRHELVGGQRQPQRLGGPRARPAVRAGGRIEVHADPLPVHAPFDGLPVGVRDAIADAQIRARRPSNPAARRRRSSTRFEPRDEPERRDPQQSQESRSARYPTCAAATSAIAQRTAGLGRVAAGDELLGSNRGPMPLTLVGVRRPPVPRELPAERVAPRAVRRECRCASNDVLPFVAESRAPLRAPAARHGTGIVRIRRRSHEGHGSVLVGTRA